MERIFVSASDIPTAVEQIADRVSAPDVAGIILYASPRYDLAELVKALDLRFRCPLIGCTTAGEITDSYHLGGIAVLALPCATFRMAVEYVPSATGFTLDDGVALKARLERYMRPMSDGWNQFGLCLIDGLSLAEELFLGSLADAFDRIPIIGGSAGDDLKFQRTSVCANSKVGSGGAAVALIQSSLPFESFHFHHYRANQQELIITDADPQRRLVFEIDGYPAAKHYAQVIGLPVDQLSPEVCTAHPFILELGGKTYLRSIQRVNPDDSLQFFCAIDEGIPCGIGESLDPIERLRAHAEDLQRKLGPLSLTLGFDCVLRRLDLTRRGLLEAVSPSLAELNFFGFSTYGEQIGAVHVNQTLTGVAFGRAKN
jgi:hypothetical protein